MLTYPSAFFDWRNTKHKPKRKTRKLVTMYDGIHPRSNVDLPYIPIVEKVLEDLLVWKIV